MKASGEFPSSESSESTTTATGKTASAGPIAQILDAINGDAVAEPSRQETDLEQKSLKAPETEKTEVDRPPLVKVEVKDRKVPELVAGNWGDVLQQLDLTGVTKTLAANCQLSEFDNAECKLKLNEHHASLWNASHEQRIAIALSELYGSSIGVSIEVGLTDVETPAELDERQQQENMAQAVVDIENDRNVQQLIDSFNGKLDPDSISPMSR